MSDLFHTLSRSRIALSERFNPCFSAGTFSGSLAKLAEKNPQSQPTGQTEASVRRPAHEPTLGERLFDATAAAKIWTSRVAMHLDRTARDRFFTQLDRLHDEEEWVGRDLPVNLESYKSLIRAFVSLGIKKGPSLALMPGGNLLAMWRAGDAMLTVEFLPGDRAKWLLSRPLGEEVERAAGETSLRRIRDVLAPYDADRWLVGR